MRFPIRWAVAVALSGLFTVPTLVVSATASDDFSWQGQLAQGQSIEIKNANGPILAESSSDGAVHVTATKQGPETDRQEVTFEVVEHDNGVTICAMFPARAGDNHCAPGEAGRITNDRNRTKVSFRVQVPAGVDFVAKTMNGAIEATNLDSNGRLMTMNGAIRASTSGWLSAKTMNGRIDCTLGATEWDGPLELETMNGAVSVVLPEGANTEVQAQTMNGKVESDWPLDKSGWFHNHARGRIGSGGRQLHIKSMNGSIRIARKS